MQLDCQNTPCRNTRESAAELTAPSPSPWPFKSGDRHKAGPYPGRPEEKLVIPDDRRIGMQLTPDRISDKIKLKTTKALGNQLGPHIKERREQAADTRSKKQEKRWKNITTQEPAHKVFKPADRSKPAAMKQVIHAKYEGKS
ncbi:hypothetical protein Tco_0456059 [Tanacetum coccineum]